MTAASRYLTGVAITGSNRASRSLTTLVAVKRTMRLTPKVAEIDGTGWGIPCIAPLIIRAVIIMHSL